MIVKYLKISVPLFIFLGKKKHTLSFNVYHNWHYRVRCALKKEYESYIHSQLNKEIFIGKVRLRLTIFRKTKVKGDRQNPLSIHEKFFCDAIVSAGVLEDDNDTIIMSTEYYTGEVDKLNPRVEIEVINV